MLKALAVIAAVLAGVLARPASAAAPPPVQVMVLGATHFANQHLDMHNVQVEDVLVPRRQAELDALCKALARFRPTKIAVEYESAAHDLSLPTYAAFTPEDLKTNRREQVQIGFRLARSVGLPAVYGVDEKARPGGPDYFPYAEVQAWAQAHGRGGELNAIGDEIGAWVAEVTRTQADHTLAEQLAAANAPAVIERLHRLGYGSMLRFNDGASQPGATLYGMWGLRNARIFAKVAAISRPGDRVLVIFGGGHAWWLRHLVQETPGFTLVDPVPYLR